MTTGVKMGLAGLVCAAFACLSPAAAKEPSLAGTWTGTAQQNEGDSGYTVVITLRARGGETDYPELSCGGTLKRIASAEGYTFYTETITRGSIASGGRCIDGTVTVAAAGDGLSWGWVGTYDGLVTVAWSDLVAK